MTRPRPRRGAPPVTETVHTSTTSAEWCPACRAYTVLTGTVLLLTASGVTTLAAWSGCEICTEEDPGHA